jgi:hypothetical protein
VLDCANLEHFLNEPVLYFPDHIGEIVAELRKSPSKVSREGAQLDPKWSFPNPPSVRPL